MSEVSELAKMTKRTEASIYYLARKLGRLPTVNEVIQIKQKRPLNSYAIEKLSEETGRCRTSIYNLKRKLGRLPTAEEVLKNKRGRKLKYVKVKEN